MSTPFQRILETNASEEVERERLRNIEIEQQELRENPPFARVARKPAKFYIHYYNHFDFISELLERVDKLEAQIATK